ncbi:MAG: hypothetical protein J7621_10135 [Niastella sp.]|nr:hypothetical protein [Niastella sp.]
MKKLFILTIFLLGGRLAMAQCINFTNYTIAPSTFTAEDEITMTFDFTGTGLAGETNLYIWTWANKGATGLTEKVGITNTDWGNSPEIAKLTPAGSPNKFTYKFTGTTMYELAPGQLKHFQFLIKTKTGSKQTCDSETKAFDPLVFIPNVLRVFPARVGQNDVVLLNFHQDLATTLNEQRMEPVSVTVEVFDNTGASAGAPITLPVKNAGAKLWKAFFVPTRSYTPGAGKKFTHFTYKFNGTIRDANNQPVTVSTAVIDVPLTDMK